MFGFSEVNGILTAVAGWEGLYLDTVETFDAESKVVTQLDSQ